MEKRKQDLKNRLAERERERVGGGGGGGEGVEKGERGKDGGRHRKTEKAVDRERGG